MIVVEWAEPLELATAALWLQRHRFGNQADDVGARAHFFFQTLVVGKDRHAQHSTQLAKNWKKANEVRKLDNW
jgi:hypothetical protein